MYNQSERTGSHVASSNVFIVFHNRKLSALYHGKPVNCFSGISLFLDAQETKLTVSIKNSH